MMKFTERAVVLSFRTRSASRAISADVVGSVADGAIVRPFVPG
jgi:hypothetical protein